MNIINVPLISIILLILQVSLFSKITWLNLQFETLFCYSVYLSIRYPRNMAVWISFYLGILHDLFSIGPAGFASIVYPFISITVSGFQTLIFTQFIGTKLLILFIFSIIATLLSAFILFWSRIDFNIIDVFISKKSDIVGIAVLNTVFSIPLYWVLDRLHYDRKS